MATVIPTDRIFFKGKYHKEVSFKGKAHKEAWMEVDGELQCVWRKNTKIGRFILTQDILDVDNKEVNFTIPTDEAEYVLYLGSTEGGFFIFENIWDGDYYITGKELKYPTLIELPSEITSSNKVAENGSGIVGISQKGFTIVDIKVATNETLQKCDVTMSSKTITFDGNVPSSYVAGYVGTMWENGGKITHIGCWFYETSQYYNIKLYSAKTGEIELSKVTNKAYVNFLTSRNSHMFTNGTIVYMTRSYIYVGDKNFELATRLQNSLNKEFYCIGLNQGYYYVANNTAGGTIYRTKDFLTFETVYSASDITVSDPESGDNYSVSNGNVFNKVISKYCDYTGDMVKGIDAKLKWGEYVFDSENFSSNRQTYHAVCYIDNFGLADSPNNFGKKIRNVK